MKSKSLSAAILCLAALVGFGAGAGAWELGARALGMGGAYVALSDDIASLAFNPAGLSNASFQVGIGLGSRDLLAVTRFVSLLQDPSSLPAGAAIDVATLSGISIAGFGAGFAALGSVSAMDSCDGFELCAEGEYLSQIVLGHGRRIAALPIGLSDLRAGVSVKRIDTRRVEYRRTIPLGGDYVATTEDWRGEGYSFSLGVQVKASEVFTIGIAANDVVSSLTWTGTRTTTTVAGGTETPVAESLGTTSDRLNPRYRLGVAIKPPFLGVTLAGDLGSDGSIRYGVEKDLFFGALSLRFGGIRADGTATTTAGLGIHLGPVRIDAGAGSADGFKTVTTMIEGSVRF